jgi:7-cyano-7-deazaguanine synthase
MLADSSQIRFIPAVQTPVDTQADHEAVSPDTPEHAVVLLSGGLDSATCAALAKREAETVTPIHINYGQQTNDVEYERATNLAGALALDDPEVIDYRDVYEHIDGGVASDRNRFVTEHGDLTDEDGRSTGYVPMRNLILLTTAAAIADVRDADAVYHGAQTGDSPDYPDCRSDFIEAAAASINASLADDDQITIVAPLLHFEKKHVLQLANHFDVPFKHTYSCYTETDADDPDPCGECPACEERQAAFEKVPFNDPIAQ